jgi:hypothetical protein
MFGDGPSLTFIWYAFVGVGIVGFVLSVVRWWASLPLIVLLGLYAVALLGELHEPDLYPVYESVKPGFVSSANIAVVLGLSLPILGIFVNVVRRIKKK